MINNIVKSILNVVSCGIHVSKAELEKKGEKSISEIFHEEKKETPKKEEN